MKVYDSPFCHSRLGIKIRHLLYADEWLHATGIWFLISAFYTAKHQTCEQSLEARAHPSEWK